MKERYPVRSSPAWELFNPSFVGVVLWQAIHSYGEPGMEFTLAFVVLPFVLHRGIRHALPPTKRTSLAMWLANHPEYSAIFPDLASEMRPYTAEGILWAGNSGAIAISDSGNLRAVRQPPNSPLVDDMIAEVSHIFSKAAFVGKWLAAAGSPSTVFAMLGVRP